MGHAPSRFAVTAMVLENFFPLPLTCFLLIYCRLDNGRIKSEVGIFCVSGRQRVPSPLFIIYKHRHEVLTGPVISLPVFAFTGRKVFILKTEGVILPTGLASDYKFTAFQHPYVFRRCFHSTGKSCHTMCYKFPWSVS